MVANGHTRHSSGLRLPEPRVHFVRVARGATPGQSGDVMAESFASVDSTKGMI